MRQAGPPSKSSFLKILYHIYTPYYQSPKIFKYYYKICFKRPNKHAFQDFVFYMNLKQSKPVWIKQVFVSIRKVIFPPGFLKFKSIFDAVFSLQYDRIFWEHRVLPTLSHTEFSESLPNLLSILNCSTVQKCYIKS